MARITSPRPAGAPTWMDLMSTDPAKAQAFYAKVFGWTYDISGPEFGNYAMAKLHGQYVAGVGGQPPGAQMPSTWNTYFESHNLEEDIARAVKLGARPIMPAMQIGENGKLAMLADPTSAVFGLWQSNKHIGAAITEEPGTMTWHELYTKDAKKARDFYASLLNATTFQMPGGMEYYVLQHGQTQIAGIMQMTPDMSQLPSHWSCYWVVKNTDETVKLVKELGGSLMFEVLDSPFGRIGRLMDPQGASFWVLQRA